MPLPVSVHIDLNQLLLSINELTAMRYGLK